MDDSQVTSDDPDVETEVTNSNVQPLQMSEISEPVKVDTAVKGRIFEGVLEVFNSALPSFLAASIDVEAQKRELLARLDSSIDAYLDTLAAEARQRADLQLRAVVDAAKDDAEKLRRQMQNVEQQKDKIREQQLSAERRRRALTDRVSDLEAQLATVEAEREQFELENRSLLNKLKVSELQGSLPDGDIMAEVTRLRERIAEFEQGSQVNKELNSQSLEQIAALQTDLNEEKEKNLTLRNQLDESAGQIESLNEQLSVQQAKNNELSASLTAKTAEIEDLTMQIAEAQKLEDDLSLLKSQFEKFDAQIKKRDDKIASLKESNRKLKDELAQTRQDMKALREADSNNLFTAAESETERIELPNLDDDFECPIWFVAEPEPGHELQRPNTEFGYVEPPKKPKAPESDAQLSLF